MNKLEIRCPGNCFKKDPVTNKAITKGYLQEIIEGSNRFFCTTPFCPFAYQDEHRKDHWINGIVPLKLPDEDGFN